MNFRLLSILSGKPLSEVKEYYNKAIKEKDFLGIKENETHFLTEMMKVYLDIEEDACSKTLSDSFIKSGKSSFNEFLESLLSEEGMTVSTDFSPAVKPETMLDANKIKKDLEDEEESK